MQRSGTPNLCFENAEVVKSYIRCGRSPEASDTGSVDNDEGFDPNSYPESPSSPSSTGSDCGNERKQTRTGFIELCLGPANPPAHASPPSLDRTRKTVGEGGERDIAQYWQNYDLSVSEAPKLFSDAEFQAVERIRHGLEVLILRQRLKERISARNRESEVRAAVRVQAMARGIAVRKSLPAIRQQHELRASVKKDQKLFKRELCRDGFVACWYRCKDGALRKVTLKPNGKLNCLCWSMGVGMVTAGSVPLVALKSCYTGYPKRDFPTKSMQARATPLPDKNKTLTIQVDNGDVYVFVTTEDGPSQKKLVKGFQSIIDEVSSPDSFYFDSLGVLRRVTCSIFDDRGNTAQREAMKKQRHERFKHRQEHADARRESLHPKQAREEELIHNTSRKASLFAWLQRQNPVSTEQRRSTQPLDGNEPLQSSPNENGMHTHGSGAIGGLQVSPSNRRSAVAEAEGDTIVVVDPKGSSRTSAGEEQAVGYGLSHEDIWSESGSQCGSVTNTSLESRKQEREPENRSTHDGYTPAEITDKAEGGRNSTRRMFWRKS